MRHFHAVLGSPFHICSRTGLSCHICTGTGLQAVVSALTAGPVAPADEIGRLNVTRIMQTCRMDGTLLKPSMPAFQLDSTFAAVLSGRGLDTFLGIESVWGTTMAARAPLVGPEVLPLFCGGCLFSSP